MSSPELQLSVVDRLIVGFRGVPLELVAALNLCRRFDGTVIFREKDVLVVEFGSEPPVLDELLTKLPRGAVTHLWRSAPATVSAAARPIPVFCAT